jgi:hypothetical protein
VHGTAFRPATAVLYRRGVRQPSSPAPRRPDYTRFLTTGAVLGAAVGLIVGLTSPLQVQHTRGAVTAYLMVGLAFTGALLTGLVAVLLDRRADRRAGHRAAARPEREPAPPVGTAGGRPERP